VQELTAASVPTFSIIVPTRNRPDTLGRALESITAQTFGDYEVLVVDDGSVEEAAAAIRALVEACGSRFEVVRRAPGSARHGPNAARNAGIRRARGTWVGFLDDDDYWCDPEHLRVAARCLEAAPDIECYVANQVARRGDEVIVDPWLPYLERVSDDRPVIDGTGVVRIRREDLLQPEGIGFGHVNITLVRRDTVERQGGFWEPAPYEGDLDFFLRLVDVAESFAYRSATVSVNTVRPVEASSGVSSIEASAKELFRMAACQHAEMLCKREATRRYARLLQAGVLKGMSRAAYDEGDIGSAGRLARRAVAIDPSLRWHAISLGLRLRSTLGL
jgi:glycosyltransferase involved in cell wall biosynthesis